jgi:phospholipid/cholesterol/gamma-HCH transport system substrate-binding protein
LRLGNEFKIGLTIVLAVLVGFIGFRVMKDAPLFRLGTVYYVEYNRVDGLSTGTSVLLSGIKIGSVQQLILLPNDSVRVALSITMPEGLPTGSVAFIRSVDLLGSKAVVVERGPGPAAVPYGGSLMGVFDEGLMGDLAETGTSITDNVNESTGRINTLLAEVEAMLAGGGRTDIEATLSNLRQVTGQTDQLISETRAEIQQTMSGLQEILSNISDLTSEERGELQRTLANLEKLTTDLQEMSASLIQVSGSLESITRKIDEGEGTLGLLVNDPSLYHNLDSLSANVNRLVVELNENPRHYLRHLRLVRIF